MKTRKAKRAVKAAMANGVLAVMRRQFERESAAVLGELWTNDFRDLGMKTVSLASEVSDLFHREKNRIVSLDQQTELRERLTVLRDEDQRLRALINAKLDQVGLAKRTMPHYPRLSGAFEKIENRIALMR